MRHCVHGYLNIAQCWMCVHDARKAAANADDKRCQDESDASRYHYFSDEEEHTALSAVCEPPAIHVAIPGPTCGALVGFVALNESDLLGLTGPLAPFDPYYLLFRGPLESL